MTIYKPIQVEYEALGGVQGAIGERAEKVFRKLDTEAQNALPTVFQEIVEVDERGEPTRRRAELKVVAPDAAAKRMVEALTGERVRLLVQDKDVRGRPMVEVAHEALLRQWPRLRDWIEKQQDNLRLRRQIQQAVQEWDERGRNPAYRLSGGRLLDAQAWLERFPAGDLEREFIVTSAQLEQERQAQELELARQAAENARRAEEAQRQAAENAKRAEVAERARARRYQVFALIAGAVGVLAVLGVIWAGVSLSTVQLETAGLKVEQYRLSTIIPGIGQFPPTSSATVAAEDAIATATQIAGAYDTETPDDIIQNFDGVEMVFVPQGCFFMGNNVGNENERPVHEVCLEAFWIDRYEVTNEQFEAQGGQAGRESWYCDPDRDGTVTDEERTACAMLPRELISWIDARAFCEEKRGVRLPTEAEWEYAARGPNSLVYPWGHEFVEKNAVHIGNSPDEPADVGSRSNGVSWVGAYDLSGNVWEWVNTIYDQEDYPYPYYPDDGREDLDRTDVPRVMRGGSFSNYEDNLGAASRARNLPDGELRDVGFRCALSE